MATTSTGLPAPADFTSTAATRARVELTVRGLLLGAAITLVFTAANVYLGLKVGLTFASSIPAAVISMAVLRAFRNASIYENNIVQTVASAAGTLSSIIFVLPGLVMVGWWTGFPFWQTFGVCAVGGILGVMYTIPLRRALVVQSDLPYPEGVAAAEVLRVGAGLRARPSTAPGDVLQGGEAAGPSAAAVAENKAGLLAVVGGSIASAGFAAVEAARVFAGEVTGYFRAGAVATGFGGSLSLALIGVGHLVGLSVGVAIMSGLIIAWGIATPVLTALHPTAGPAADVANAVWSHKVRFIGAGAIGIAAIWTLIKLARPVWGGVLSAVAASRHQRLPDAAELPRTERDMPIGIVTAISLVLLIPLAVLFVTFLSGGALRGLIVPLVIGAVIYVVIAGFLVAAACGYMAGLIGSSNSPVSGLAILAVIGAALLLLVLSGHGAGATLVAFALFVTAVVLCVATIANDNLQDLKTGQLVDATPWRQQVALIVGVIIGALVIPPILDLLNHAYGFAGAPHLRGAAVTQPLPAPQATLISALAKGIVQGQLDWGLIGIGVLAGIAIIVIDELLGIMRQLRLPPLAVGLGIYLPVSTTFPIVIGAVIGWAYNHLANRGRNPEAMKRLGVLLASGLIVGESLFGVLLAAIIVATGKSTPLAIVGDSFATASTVLGSLAFVLVIAGLYAWTARLAQRAG
ncbi:MAG: oligopeptide transporter, OPT family [Candidatus Eremiobacteraeota bacterium]|nr:oligopeptide transporter, OPT family [Candidatus Eremiobacteraeota bacterium]MBC5801696.1 oligopeptide transporter, OPT family [Candidatus Eremiobacteraeota bacterium]MBC5821260.1 oligopeptide transporter, OPT family [Candidatus Eremiobacteraeota bacterium]